MAPSSARPMGPCLLLSLVLGCSIAPALAQWTHPCRFCPSEPDWAEPEPPRRLEEGTPELVIHLGAPRQTLQAWGTSLCWWANGVGGWNDHAKLGGLLDLIFSDFSAESMHRAVHGGGPLPESLGLTQARYNIGGGEDPRYLHFMRDGGAVEGYQAANQSWNWAADASQRAVLAGALKRGVSMVHAFSNSPPAWMTISGSATGAKGGGPNLKWNQYDAFARYLAVVVKRFATDPALLGGRSLVFDAVTPINEPNSDWWKFGNNQEGCHFSPGQQSRILAMLDRHIRALGITRTPTSAAEENWVDGTVRSVKAYSSEVQRELQLVATHTYGASKWARPALARWAAEHGKPLWNSEFGTGSGPLQGGISLAQAIVEDLRDLNCTVWTLWQAADLDDSLGKDGWGLIAATYRRGRPGFRVRKQYHSFKQFTAFIRPGSTIVSVTSAPHNVSAIAAMIPGRRSLVLVAANAGREEVRAPLTLSGTPSPVSVQRVSAYRTDETHDCEPVRAPVLQHGRLQLALPRLSITTLVMDLAHSLDETPHFV